MKLRIKIELFKKLPKKLVNSFIKKRKKMNLNLKIFECFF